MITSTSTESSRREANYNFAYVWLISSVAAMGGSRFGWDWVEVGGAKPFFQRYFELTSERNSGLATPRAVAHCCERCCGVIPTTHSPRT